MELLLVPARCWWTAMDGQQQLLGELARIYGLSRLPEEDGVTLFAKTGSSLTSLPAVCALANVTNLLFLLWASNKNPWMRALMSKQVCLLPLGNSCFLKLKPGITSAGITC